MIQGTWSIRPDCRVRREPSAGDSRTVSWPLRNVLENDQGPGDLSPLTVMMERRARRGLGTSCTQVHLHHTDPRESSRKLAARIHRLWFGPGNSSQPITWPSCSRHLALTPNSCIALSSHFTRTIVRLEHIPVDIFRQSHVLGVRHGGHCVIRIHN
jgi:hypothetical protein